MPSPTPSSSTTQLRAGIEQLEPDSWVISVFDLLGCFSSGRTEEEAVAQAGNRVRQYFEWLGKKDGNPARFEEAVQVLVVERGEVFPWPKDPAIPVRAFFEDDARSLRPWDLDIAMRLLEWSRQDFLRLSGALLPDFLSQPENAPNWKTLDGLLDHMWETENMILNRMGTSVDAAEMPGDAVGRLQLVRKKFLEKLPEWAEADILVEEFGEKWSPRKALRRVLWHERDHIGQLEGLITHRP
ncbi:MAG: DinB family protein [Anaerolineales bacterium]|nr:DinB family protein [Anaerolineales bacterium]